jgi:hypothetical protein
MRFQAQEQGWTHAASQLETRTPSKEDIREGILPRLVPGRGGYGHGSLLKMRRIEDTEKVPMFLKPRPSKRPTVCAILSWKPGMVVLEKLICVLQRSLELVPFRIVTSQPLLPPLLAAPLRTQE